MISTLTVHQYSLVAVAVNLVMMKFTADAIK